MLWPKRERARKNVRPEPWRAVGCSKWSPMSRLGDWPPLQLMKVRGPWQGASQRRLDSSQKRAKWNMVTWIIDELITLAVVGAYWLLGALAIHHFPLLRALSGGLQLERADLTRRPDQLLRQPKWSLHNWHSGHCPLKFNHNYQRITLGVQSAESKFNKDVIAAIERVATICDSPKLITKLHFLQKGHLFYSPEKRQTIVFGRSVLGKHLERSLVWLLPTNGNVHSTVAPFETRWSQKALMKAKKDQKFFLKSDSVVVAQANAWSPHRQWRARLASKKVSIGLSKQLRAWLMAINMPIKRLHAYVQRATTAKWVVIERKVYSRKIRQTSKLTETTRSNWKVAGGYWRKLKYAILNCFSFSLSVCFEEEEEEKPFAKSMA